MSLGNKSGCTQPNNEKSINPYVTVKGNILVSECCGSEMAYRVSETNEGYSFDMWDFCPQCLDCCETLEVKSSEYDREIYLDEYDNFNFEWYDAKTFQIIPKCLSVAFTEEELKTKCFYCKTTADEIQGVKVGLLSFKLVGQTINKELDNLIVKACQNCYFTNEEELKEVE
tara:strand:- start:2097 stop:2609 length:513 start_codon:yes stop_codon:yes gene_type:complete